MNGKQRWELFKNFMPFLMMLFVANIAIVVLRDIKEDFLVNIIDVSEYSPWLFAKIDSVVTLIILVVFGLMVFVKDNLKALSILFGLIIMVMIAMYKQRLWTNSQTTGGSWNRSCPKETTDITIIPIIINPKRIERAFRFTGM